MVIYLFNKVLKLILNLFDYYRANNLFNFMMEYIIFIDKVIESFTMVKLASVNKTVFIKINFIINFKF